MEQLIAHLFGDYVIQSDWMANNKTNKSVACLAHCLTYAIPFLFITWSPLALFVIISTHFVIDRFRLAKYVAYAKNFIAPPSAVLNINADDAEIKEGAEFLCVKDKYRWENCKATGYTSETPPFLAVWLMIIADNTFHLLINYLALKYL